VGVGDKIQSEKGRNHFIQRIPTLPIPDSAPRASFPTDITPYSVPLALVPVLHSFTEQYSTLAWNNRFARELDYIVCNLTSDRL
jgi:hypothetical protein